MQRPHKLALLSALLAAGLTLATSAAASATTDPNSGYDISYPQCNGSFPAPGAFGIAGVNGGRLYSANPCLGAGDGASELAWAERYEQPAILYANTADPGPANTLMQSLNKTMDARTFAESAAAQRPLTTADGTMTKDRWQTLIQQLTDLKVIEKAPPAEECFADLPADEPRH